MPKAAGDDELRVLLVGDRAFALAGCCPAVLLRAGGVRLSDRRAKHTESRLLLEELPSGWRGPGAAGDPGPRRVLGWLVWRGAVL